jgi:hypothetical protein
MRTTALVAAGVLGLCGTALAIPYNASQTTGHGLTSLTALTDPATWTVVTVSGSSVSAADGVFASVSIFAFGGVPATPQLVLGFPLYANGTSGPSIDPLNFLGPIHVKLGAISGGTATLKEIWYYDNDNDLLQGARYRFNTPIGLLASGGDYTFDPGTQIGFTAGTLNPGLALSAVDSLAFVLEFSNPATSIQLDLVPVTPEPGTIALFGLGALGLGGLAWRRRKAKPAPAK